METSTNFLIDPNNFYKQADIFFTHNTLNKDLSIWKIDREQSEEISFERFREQTTDIKYDQIATIFLLVSPKRAVIITTVEKLSQVLERSGGISGVFYPLIQMITRYLNRKKNF
jgi:hypothetical protein